MRSSKDSSVGASIGVVSPVAAGTPFSPAMAAGTPISPAEVFTAAAPSQS